MRIHYVTWWPWTWWPYRNPNGCWIWGSAGRGRRVSCQRCGGRLVLSEDGRLCLTCGDRTYPPTREAREAEARAEARRRFEARLDVVARELADMRHDLREEWRDASAAYRERDPESNRQAVRRYRATPKGAVANERSKRRTSAKRRTRRELDT